MVPSDFRYTQVGSKLILVQVCNYVFGTIKSVNKYVVDCFFMMNMENTPRVYDLTVGLLIWVDYNL